MGCLNYTERNFQTAIVFQYNSLIVQPFEMILGTVSLVTSIHRLNKIKTDSKNGCSLIRKDFVHFPGFAPGAPCQMFLLCVYLYLHQTTTGQLYSITQMPTYDWYEFRGEESGCGLHPSPGPAETDSIFF